MGGELKVFLEVPKERLFRLIPPKIAQGIMRVREGKVRIKCGYDGVYGEVNIFGKEEKEEEKQLELF